MELKNTCNPLPKKTREEIIAENKAIYEKMMSVRFTVDRKDLLFDQSENEVIFYMPEYVQEVENSIISKYNEIKDAFKKKNYTFIFLPYFNKGLKELLSTEIINYYNPYSTNLFQLPVETLTYNDIKEALKIPEKVDSPCFIRCIRKNNDPVIFSFFKLNETKDILANVEEYLNNVGAGKMYYSLLTDEQIRNRVEGLPADDRFDIDVYLIGKEIRDRIDQLRAKGLPSLAIRKLIGDDSDKPGKLLIDKHNKIILTDFGNKEIKMEPLQKAVFFLFLRHPEGIYFKNLVDYKEELSNIYKVITGREDKEAIEHSINRLTDPMDNSINEKCARIKNAFVSEFREEVAQWYIINGHRGGRKNIKLPRDLVSWEVRE